MRPLDNFNTLKCRKVTRASSHSQSSFLLPSAIVSKEGTYILPVLLIRLQLDELKKDGTCIDILFDGVPAGQDAKGTTGEGEIFKGGSSPPHGQGSRPHGE
jgi:hypothetical protein